MEDRSLGTRTSEAVGAAPPTVVLLPLGATEQHGSHLPLDTDTRIAAAVADAVAGLVPGAVVAPPLAIAASGEHHGFPGTLSIGTRVLGEVLVEIVRNAGPELARIVVVNAHGGNADALRSAGETCAAEGRRLDVWSVRIPGGDAHAGRSETSLMLHLAPELVDLDRAAAGATEPLEELLPRLRVVGVAGVSANGVLGDPTGASAAEGAALFAALVADAVAHVTGA